MSIAQYVTAISRYHELLHTPSPTHTPLVSALVNDYSNKHDLKGAVKSARIDLAASLVRRLVICGLQTSDIDEVGYCTCVLLAFASQCRSVSGVHLKNRDRKISPMLVAAIMIQERANHALGPCVCSFRPTSFRDQPTLPMYYFASGSPFRRRP